MWAKFKLVASPASESADQDPPRFVVLAAGVEGGQQDQGQDKRQVHISGGVEGVNPPPPNFNKLSLGLSQASHSIPYKQPTMGAGQRVK